MAKFTRKIAFTAYQFNPKQLRGLDDYDVEDIIIAALEIGQDIKHAFVTDDGKLSITLYTYGEEQSKAYFEMELGEWLTTNDQGRFHVVPDAKFKQDAEPA